MCVMQFNSLKECAQMSTTTSTLGPSRPLNGELNNNVESRDSSMMEFKALRASTLTEEVAENLEDLLSNLAGVKEFTIRLETQELSIMFDEKQLGFHTLAEAMAKAGCSLRDIDAALLL